MNRIKITNNLLSYIRKYNYYKLLNEFKHIRTRRLDDKYCMIYLSNQSDLNLLIQVINGVQKAILDKCPVMERYCRIIQKQLNNLNLLNY